MRTADPAMGERFAGARSVLVTGAFGNLGQLVLAELKRRGYRVVAMDLQTAATRKAAASSPHDEVIWADIRQIDWDAALRGIDAVIHLAALLPPVTERLPELTKAVNLDASIRLIEALERRLPQAPHLVFPSSVTVFGYPVGPTLKRVEDAPSPSDVYTRYKLAVEQRLAESSIPWSVLRVGVSVDSRGLKTEWSMVRKLFNAAPDNPVEYVHPADVATAMVNAVENPLARGRIWLLGGGPSCRITQYEFLSASMGAMGIALPRDLLGAGSFYTHWMDTAESERVLKFQKRSFDDYRRELARKYRWRRPVTALLSPLIVWGLRRALRTSTAQESSP